MQTAAGIQKGLKTILVERGKFMDSGGGPLRKICKAAYPFKKELLEVSIFKNAVQSECFQKSLISQSRKNG